MVEIAVVAGSALLGMAAIALVARRLGADCPHWLMAYGSIGMGLLGYWVLQRFVG